MTNSFNKLFYALAEPPPGYRLIRSFDPTRRVWIMVLLNIAGFFVMGAAGALALAWGQWVRPLALNQTMADSGDLRGSALISGAIVIGLFVGMVVIHEAIHGIFFWIFTRSRPVFAVHLTHAYAAAPGWYLSRSAYLITGLAPLVLMGLACLIMIAVGPPGWALPSTAIFAFNTGGAVGDLAICVWVITRPSGSLFRDRGDGVDAFSNHPIMT